MQSSKDDGYKGLNAKYILKYANKKFKLDKEIASIAIGMGAFLYLFPEEIKKTFLKI